MQKPQFSCFENNYFKTIPKVLANLLPISAWCVNKTNNFISGDVNGILLGYHSLQSDSNLIRQNGLLWKRKGSYGHHGWGRQENENVTFVIRIVFWVNPLMMVLHLCNIECANPEHNNLTKILGIKYNSFATSNVKI